MRQLLQAIVRVGCLVAVGTIVASAQPSLQLTGVVRDTTGSVLPGVTMTVTGAALTAPRTVVTDQHGGYVVDGLAPGRYLVTAAFSGFEPSSTAIEVRATAATLDVVLAVSSLAERVTVTATKTGAADVQSTPVAITVLPAAALEQMGVHTVEGLAGVAPTVTISQHTGLAQVTIRGIGTNSTFGDPSSTVHLDGVYLGRPAMVFADFLNVDRVEVLRGPQGTLYGRNSVGGTINIVTRQPSNTLETSVRLTAGNYHELRAEGAVSGPLIKNKVMGNFARISIIPTIRSAAKTRGPDEGSCVSSSGRTANCCCRATVVNMKGYRSPTPKLLWQSPTTWAASTTQPACGGCGRATGRPGRTSSRVLRRSWLSG